jgi:putative ABC transport system permease protein
MQLASQSFGDLRHGLRLLARRPVFAAAAVLTLAIGAGASSAVFSAVRTVLLAPLPFRDPGRLVTVWDQNLAARIARSPVSDANYADWKRLNRCFSAMAAYDTWAPTLVSGGDPETLTGAVVDSDFFAVLGVQPLIGHGFDRQEIGSGARPVILSYGLWQRRFGGDPRIIGQRIQFSDRVAAVAGVMPPDFMHPGPDIRGVAVEIWNAKRFQAESDRRNDHLYVFARLKPEIVPEQAQMEMTLLSERLAQQHPENTGYQARVVPLQTDFTGDVKRLLWLSFAAVMCLTLIACANLATLLLSRAAEREREFAIRRAMGAPGWQLVSQSLAESGGIALIGGSLALVLASAGIRTLGAAAAGYIPRMRYLRLDSMMVVFVFSVSLLCSLLCGIAPAMRAARLNSSDSFGDASRGSSQKRRHKRRCIVFLTADVAFTFMLVVSGALLIESFQALLRVDPGCAALARLGR